MNRACDQSKVPYIVYIDGGIGVGKTSLIKSLDPEKFHVFIEDFRNSKVNDLLNRLYAGDTSVLFALQVEIFLTFQRRVKMVRNLIAPTKVVYSYDHKDRLSDDSPFRQRVAKVEKSLSEFNKVIVFDRSVDAMKVFIEASLDKFTLKQVKHLINLIDDLQNTLDKWFGSRQIYVQVESTPELMQSRSSARNDDIESEISFEYLQKIQDLHAEHIRPDITLSNTDGTVEDLHKDFMYKIKKFTWGDIE